MASRPADPSSGSFRLRRRAFASESCLVVRFTSTSATSSLNPDRAKSKSIGGGNSLRIDWFGVLRAPFDSYTRRSEKDSGGFGRKLSEHTRLEKEASNRCGCSKRAGIPT